MRTSRQRAHGLSLRHVSDPDILTVIAQDAEQNAFGGNDGFVKLLSTVVAVTKTAIFNLDVPTQPANA
jgi:hypothetical protein